MLVDGWVDGWNCKKLDLEEMSKDDFPDPCIPCLWHGTKNKRTSNDLTDFVCETVHWTWFSHKFTRRFLHGCFWNFHKDGELLASFLSSNQTTSIFVPASGVHPWPGFDPDGFSLHHTSILEKHIQNTFMSGSKRNKRALKLRRVRQTPSNQTFPIDFYFWGRPAVAVHFFNDFTLKMSTVVGLQASLKKTNACFYVNGLSYLAGTLKC